MPLIARFLLGVCLTAAVAAIVGSPVGAAEKKSVEALSLDEYEKPLIEIVATVETAAVGFDAIVSKMKPYLARQDLIGKESFLQRNWPNKKLFHCELAAYKVVSPQIHYAYVLVITDREPIMWEFKIFRTKKEGWAIYAYKYGPDLGPLGGEMKVLWKEKEKAKAEEEKRKAESAAGKTNP